MRNTPYGQVGDILHVFVHLICYIVRYFTQKRTRFSLTMIENTQPNIKGNTFKHCNWWPRPKYQMFCTEDFCSICCPTSMFITDISLKGHTQYLVGCCVLDMFFSLPFIFCVFSRFRIICVHFFNNKMLCWLDSNYRRVKEYG